MSWREVATKALREAGPTKADKSAAMKRAGEEWRGHRRNPGINLTTIGLAIGGFIVLTKVILPALQPKPSTGTAAPTPTPTYTGQW